MSDFIFSTTVLKSNSQISSVYQLAALSFVLLCSVLSLYFTQITSIHICIQAVKRLLSNRTITGKIKTKVRNKNYT